MARTIVKAPREVILREALALKSSSSAVLQRIRMTQTMKTAAPASCSFHLMMMKTITMDCCTLHRHEAQQLVLYLGSLEMDKT